MRAAAALGVAPAAAADGTPVALWVAGVLFALGLVFIVLPVLPGLLICVAAVLVWAFATGTTAGWVTFALVVATYLGGVTLQVLLPGRRMKAQGIGLATIGIGLAAGLVGLFVVPIVGGPLFFVLGVLAVEYARSRDRDQAWRATKGALRGVLHSIGIELLAALVVLVIWVAGILFHRL